MNGTKPLAATVGRQKLNAILLMKNMQTDATLLLKNMHTEAQCNTSSLHSRGGRWLQVNNTFLDSFHQSEDSGTKIHHPSHCKRQR
jgi:hypothetical protein